MRDPVRDVATTEAALERARRTLLMLTRCNEAVLRAESEAQLYRDVCQVIVDTGGYRMCWMGLIEDDERRSIRPVAHAGHEDGYLATIDVVWGDGPRGRGPTGTAAREGRVVVGRNFAREPDLAPWREAALRRGYASSTALPIAFGENRYGVLTMYSGDAHVFSDEELELLRRLAEDLGHGVDGLRRRVAQQRAERELRESREWLRDLFDLSPDATVISRARDGVVVDVNESFRTMAGWSGPEAVGRSSLELGIWADPEDRDLVIHRIETDGVARNIETRLRRRDGKLLDVLVSARLLPQGGETLLLTLFRDVSDVNLNARRYRLLADNARDVIWTLDLPTLRFTYVSPAIRRLRGLTVEQALAEPLEESMTPESLERVARLVSERVAADEDGAFTGVFDQPCADGSVKHVEITTSFVRDATGRPVEILGVSRDATARVEAERALERRERELRTILESAIDGFATIDEHGVIVEANDALAGITGYPLPDLVGKHVAELERIDDAAAIAARMARIRSVGSDRFETRYRRRDGRDVDIEISVRFSPSGRDRYHAFFRDVTDRKRDEVALRENQRRLATIVRVARTGFLITRLADRRIVDANDAWLAQVGLARDRALGRTTVELGIFADAATPDRLYHALQREGDGPPVEVRLRTPDGAPADFLLTAAQAEIGGEACVISAWHDVTALHRADAALRESEARFRTLIERSSDIIVLLDAAGKVAFWSPGAVQSLGLPADEAVGATLADLVRVDDQPAFAEALAGVLARPSTTERIAVKAGRAGGGWRSLEGEVRNLLADPAVGAIVLNLRDVTEHQLLEEQYRQAQRLESIGRLAGGVAHDFNNLLTVILSCSESMRQDRDAGRPVADEDIAEVHEAGERARDLTRQLLAFARRQVIAPVPLDLNAVVRGSEKLLLRVLGEDVRLAVDLAPDLWTTLCDASQIEQVLLNLAVNARDAMPGGGALTLSTRNVHVGEEEAEGVREARPGDWVRIVVSDTGSGMPPEVLAHLFEPFFTTKERGKGTGLGLATVHGIVAQSGGHVHVHSEEGRGTTFEICLPRCMRDVHRPSPPVKSGARRGCESVLVVEDDPGVRAVTVRALEEQGYEVLCAPGGAEAIAQYRSAGRPIHLVVTDVVMPGMSGREVVDELRRSEPGLRALFVSGYTQDAIAQRGVLDSGVEFLQKPFTAVTLVARVREVLDGSPPAAPPAGDGEHRPRAEGSPAG